MATYNGHKNYNHWNVALWINKDTGLYQMARDHVRNCSGTRDQAARNILSELHANGQYCTPDSVRYTVTTIRAVLVGIT